jgi:hypothetical protein
MEVYRVVEDSRPSSLSPEWFDQQDKIASFGEIYTHANGTLQDNATTVLGLSVDKGSIYLGEW